MAGNQNVIVDVEDASLHDHELKFQDFPHDQGADNYDSDSPNADTHNFSNFPNTAVSDEDEGEEDKAQLLSEKEPAFWTFEYYQQFFDVETHQVLYRILGSMVPTPRGNFLKRQIRSNPDLYGPFWVCATLVFTTAIAGNMANYLQSAGAYNWTYSFEKVTLAATAIYSYWWLVPSLLFGVLWWRSSQAGYTFLEIICVYGYSLAIYIPISILWVIQVNWLQWLLVILGAVLSGSVLLLTFWPAVRDDTRKAAFAVMALIFILHAALAVGFVLYFFHVPNTGAVSPTNAVLHNVTNEVPITLTVNPAAVPVADSQHSQRSAVPHENIIKPLNTNPVRNHVKSRSTKHELINNPAGIDTMKKTLRIGLNSMVSAT